jgi:uncharacterized protein (TIGR00730 family)
LKRICVFCGSSPGSHPKYLHAARELGRLLVRQGIELVYGGARVGMMGAIATTVLQEGGKVIGVIPRGLAEKEVAFTNLTDLRVVDSMHERKALMAELSDAFIALPGGLGTIEEFFEILTWGQLGLHHKPCGLLDIGGYFHSLLSFLDHAVDQQFIEPEHRSMILVDEQPAALLEQFRCYQPPTVDKAKWALRLAKGNPNT